LGPDKAAAYLRLIRGETQGPLARIARVGLSAAASAYALGVAARNATFTHGARRIRHVEVPVISVGNLTLGGTGKTPMVEWIARSLRERGLRVAILSRGYGQRAGLNDEGRVLEDNLPDVPHLQGADRTLLARTAIDELHSQVLVLDDGFQHRRLGRDLDIVLLDALDPFGLGRMFPRGLLREPVSSLRRAAIVVLSRADMVEPQARLNIRDAALRCAPVVRWAEARHAPRDLVDAEGGMSPLPAPRTKAVAFCGLGNPEGFRRTLGQLDLDLGEFRTFPDHHPYSRADVASLAQWAAGSGVQVVLTTQKDLVKLRVAHLGAVPLRALRIGLEIIAGAPDLRDALQAAVRRVGDGGRTTG
jgi:tetraacyldisaccharide 4'-kinase